MRRWTWIITAVLAAGISADAKSQCVDIGARDTLKLGCPEFEIRNDSMFIPVRVWSDGDIGGAIIAFLSDEGKPWRFMVWQDVADAAFSREADLFFIWHDTRGNLIRISLGDEELWAKLFAGSPHRGVLVGEATLVSVLPDRSDSTVERRKAAPFPSQGMFFYTQGWSNPELMNCDTVHPGWPPPETPLGRFSFGPDTGYAPLTVRFQDESLRRTADWQVSWYFDDGDSSRGLTAEHTFVEPGEYQPIVRYGEYPMRPVRSLHKIIVLDSTAVGE